MKPSVVVTLFASIGVVVACSSTPDAPTKACTPGQSIACVGAGGCSGGQSCLSDGSGYGACTCGSTDGGVDSGTDGGADGGPSATIGKVCASDGDCTGPGEKCSSDAFGADPIQRTAICVSLGCTPSTSAPKCNAGAGACTKTTGGASVCTGACTFDTSSGAAPTGCNGSNVCRFAGTVGSAPVTGVGACIGGCTIDKDCAAGKCQTDTGECVAAVVTRTKKIGDSCTVGENGCLCPKPSTGVNAVCTIACTIGGDACPTGFACDAGLPDGVFTKAPSGLAGLCLKTCAQPADCGAGACASAPGLVQKVCRL